MSKISIIVPVYNVELYLHRCIDSILAQTFTDFELILVDDGSPDNCGKICDEYAEKDNRIHVIHKANGGLSDARNAGIDWAFANSNSEWITFIDSDDWIHPKYLESLYNAVKETGCEISICGYEETTGDNPIVDECRLQSVIVNTEDFFCEHNVNAVIACAKLYKKELFREIRYPVGKLHEDEFTTYKLLFQYENCAFVKQPLYSYFINNAGITKVGWTARRLDAFDAYDEQLKFFYNNKYNKALNRVAVIKANELNNCIDKVKHLENKKRVLSNIRKKLKYHLHEYKRIANLTIRKYPNYYNNAYPLLMRFYWIVKSKLK